MATYKLCELQWNKTLKEAVIRSTRFRIITLIVITTCRSNVMIVLKYSSSKYNMQIRVICNSNFSYYVY